MKNVTTLLTKEQKADIKKILKKEGKSVAINSYSWYEDRKAMGSGGVGQIQFKKRLGQIRVQTSYGTGRWNYADVIIINI